MKSTRWAQRRFDVQRCVFLATAVLVGADASLATASENERVFESDGVLTITIRAPFNTLFSNAKNGVEAAGSIQTGDDPAIPTIFSPYGKSRILQCSLSPLKLELSQPAVRGTPLEGSKVLRMVNPCHRGDEFDTLVLLEYLIYESYSIIAEPALRVRLVRFKGIDSNRRKRMQKGYAFLLEDIHRAAGRHAATWIDVGGLDSNTLSSFQLSVISLFQFMVGNTDWSPLTGGPGERCCHNVAPLLVEGDPVTTLLPYDFDQAGLVNAPYASVDPRLGIQRVTQRLYRGYCWHNDTVGAAVELFNSRRPELEALFNRADLPNRPARKRALKYVRSFFEIINDSKKLRARVIGRCR